MAGEIQGLDHVLRTLRTLPVAVQGKTLRSGMAAGARSLTRTARSQLPPIVSRTGALARNVSYRRGKKPSPLFARYVIGVTHIAGAGVDSLGGVKGSRSASLKRVKLARGVKKALAEVGITYDDLGRLSGRKLAGYGMNPFYFRFLELGTKRIPRGKYSFLGPSIGAGARAAENAVVTQLRKQFDKLAKDIKR